MPRKNTRLGTGNSGASGGGFASLGGGASRSSFVPSGNAKADLQAYRLRLLQGQVADGNVPGFDGQSPEGDYTKAIARLLSSPDVKAQAAGKSLSTENPVDAVTAASLGLSANILKSKQDSVGGKALKALTPVTETLKFLGRPANAVEELIQAAAYDTGLNKVMTHEAFLPEDGRPMQLVNPGKEHAAASKVIGDAAGSGGYRDALSALWGSKRWDPVAQEFTNDLSFAHALGADPTQLPGVSGRVAGVADFTGTAAVDPLNFVGAGEAKAAATAAEKAAGLVVAEGAARELTPTLSRELGRLGAEQGAERLAPEIVQQAIRKAGLRKALTPAQRAALEETLKAEAAAGGGRTTRNLITGTTRTVPLKEDGLIRKTTLGLTGQGGRTAEEKVAQDLLTKAEMFDRGGLRVAGRSVVPEGVRAPLRGLARESRVQVGAVNAEGRILSDAAQKAEDLAQKAERNAQKAADRAAKAAAIPGVDPGPGRWHGSSSEIGNVADNAYGGSGADNLYGPGFYTTDDFAVAGKYTKKGRGVSPSVYKVEWLGDTPPKFLNLDTATATPEISQSIERAINYVDAADEDIAAVRQALADGEPLSSVYDKVRTAMSGAGLPKSEADDIFDGINRNIQDLGYDGFSHEGGRLTGGVKHNVEIYFPDVVAEGKVQAVKQEVQQAPEALKALKTAKGLATKAENQKAKAAALAAETDAARLLEVDPTLGHVREPVVETVPRRLLPDTNLTGTFKSPMTGERVSGVEALRDAFSPRSALRRSKSLPLGTDESVYAAGVQGATITKQEHQLGERLLNQYAKNTNVLTPEFTTELRQAMDIGGDFDAWKATLTPEQQAAAEALNGLSAHNRDLLIKHALADPAKLRKEGEYLPRYLTDEGREAARKYADLYPEDTTFSQFSSAKQKAGQGGHLLKRNKITADWTLDALNADMTQKLVDSGFLKPGENALELDPAKIIARRFDDTMPALQLNQQARAMQRSVKGILGEDLVHVIDPGQKVPKGLRERGFKVINLSEDDSAGALVVHPELESEVNNYIRQTIKPDAVGGFGKMMDGWNRLWKSYATVPVLTGTGFHVKNTIGNMFNNYLAGVKFYAYKDAIEIQKDMLLAKRAFPDMAIPEAMAAHGVEPNRIAKAELALEHQVLDEGFFNTDLGTKADLLLKGKQSKGEYLKSKVNIKEPDKMLGVPGGRWIGEHVEDNARLAHFISKMDETGDAATAAASVRKYLFDYGDLTPFERKVMKRINAFYTFARKNTPLQFQEIARNPAAVRRLALTKDAVLGNSDGEDVPSYAYEIGNPMGAMQARAVSGGPNQVVGNIDTPLDAAGKVVDPLLAIAGRRSGQEVAQSLAGNVSGGPAEAGKAIVEYGTGRSLFTGSDLKDPETGAYKVSPGVRISNAFMPNISKGLRVLGVESGPFRAGVKNDSDRLRVIKALTGLQAREVTPEMRKQAKNERLRTVEDIIKALIDSGVDVPTLEELQAIGALQRPD